MEKDSFDFKTNTTYKIKFKRTYRETDCGTYITYFLRHTPWHLEFGHPMMLETKHTDCGECGLRWEDIEEVLPVSNDEHIQWCINTNGFISSIMQEDGYDPCYEDVTKVTNYTGE